MRRNITILYLLAAASTCPYVLLLADSPFAVALGLRGSVEGPLELIVIWIYLLVCALWTHAAVSILLLERATKKGP